MKTFTLISVAVAALTTSVLAAPVLTIDMNVDGRNTRASQMGALTDFGDFSYQGSIGDGYPIASWVVGWDLVSQSGATSFVTNGFTIANLSGTTKRFNITLEVIDTAPVGNGWQFSGSLAGTLTSRTANASTIAAFSGNPLWQGFKGGSSPSAYAKLLTGYSLTSPGSTTTLIDSTSITPFTVAGPLGASLGYQFQFDLSGNSSATFTGNWGATLVPAPGAFALMGFAGMILHRRRRSL